MGRSKIGVGPRRYFWKSRFCLPLLYFFSFQIGLIGSFGYEVEALVKYWLHTISNEEYARLCPVKSHSVFVGFVLTWLLVSVQYSERGVFIGRDSWTHSSLEQKKGSPGSPWLDFSLFTVLGGVGAVGARSPSIAGWVLHWSWAVELWLGVRGGHRGGRLITASPMNVGLGDGCGVEHSGEQKDGTGREFSGTGPRWWRPL